MGSTPTPGTNFSTLPRHSAAEQRSDAASWSNRYHSSRITAVSRDDHPTAVAGVPGSKVKRSQRRPPGCKGAGRQCAYCFDATFAAAAAFFPFFCFFALSVFLGLLSPMSGVS